MRGPESDVTTVGTTEVHELSLGDLWVAARISPAEHPGTAFWPQRMAPPTEVSNGTGHERTEMVEVRP